jgi:crotonobetainyl-CoA:carnitine CoA-transferase CaiB-like acyl-CoA transferase
VTELIGGGDADIEKWLAHQDAEAAAERFAEAGIPAAVVISPSLVTENPQLVHRGFFERLDHPRTGEGLYPCPPFTRLGTQPWLRRTPPTLGQHNEEVLTELCGLTTADLERLAADDVIGTRPKGA